MLTSNTKITSKLFSRGIKDDGLQVRYPTLTIKEWIEGIYDGTDHLTKERDCESMGSLKDRTEIYDGEDVGIFEYRGAQRTKLGFNEWEQFALKWTETISALPHLDKRN